MKNICTHPILVYDEKTDVATKTVAGLGESSSVFNNDTYDVLVPAHSIQQIMLDDLLAACFCGSVDHAAIFSGFPTASLAF